MFAYKKIKNMLSKYRLYYLLFVPLIWLILSSCEDPVPFDYVRETYVQAFLIVDEPIQNIAVMYSQPLNEVYNYNKSMVRDADVKIIGEDQEFVLSLSTDSSTGYFYADTSYKVKPKTKYKIEIKLKDGTVLTGETLTPDRFSWASKPPDLLQYPKDTLNLPQLDSVKLMWTKVPSVEFYLISIKCTDTLDYGKYLTPPTNEGNRRIERPWNQDNWFKETTNWALIPNTQTPIVWNIHKWYGRHQISIYAPDYNYLRWFIQVLAKNQYDPLLGSITGGIGVFGSASVIRNDYFLIKNQQ